tara:strand:+ start:368 stop:622 length:255 start_codon:yes stop_codon:yes gene_type:complete
MNVTHVPFPVVKRKKGVSNGDIKVKAAKKVSGDQLKLKNHSLSDFYWFQGRREKIDRMRELRSKFEADKERIARMHAQRRFKPY